jgi:hypothetical protein
MSPNILGEEVMKSASWKGDKAGWLLEEKADLKAGHLGNSTAIL